MTPNEVLEVLLQRVAALEARLAQLEALPADLVAVFEAGAQSAPNGDAAP